MSSDEADLRCAEKLGEQTAERLLKLLTDRNPAGFVEEIAAVVSDTDRFTGTLVWSFTTIGEFVADREGGGVTGVERARAVVDRHRLHAGVGTAAEGWVTEAVGAYLVAPATMRLFLDAMRERAAAERAEILAEALLWVTVSGAATSVRR
ncbi:hypothetical protein [Prescottella subtropica]|uniref:hypothetical protein n=1 Tax=Prescottella subtropica TaxID=2545757 RepID=UPI0010F603ED|nr:hypothetical protein [Prescottella subtropica]